MTNRSQLPVIDEAERLKNQKRYSDARRLIEDSLARYPDRYELYEEVADIYIYEGEHEKAAKALDYAEKLESWSATGLYLRWYMALIKNDFDRAISYLEESNKKSPNNPEVLRNLGWAYTMIGDIKKWILILERALVIAPDDLLIMEDLWVALLTQGKVHEARMYLSKVWKESHITDMWFPV